MKQLSKVKSIGQDLYTAEDDFWKIYSWAIEKSRLTRALEKQGVARGTKDAWMKDSKGQWIEVTEDWLEKEAADIVKNNIPNYDYVPDFIKGLRKLPIGNFVSFPAEMLRTGATSTAMSLKNIRSDNPAIRQMGYKQLIGAYLALKGIGKGAHAIANFVTGNSEEQWEAYKRSGAAPWDQNSNLIGILPWKDGESAAINFSYFSPYDVLERPVQAALSMAHKQDIAADQIDNYVLSLLFAEDCPLMELMQPTIQFMNEPQNLK